MEQTYLTTQNKRLRPPLPRKLHRRSQRSYRCSYDCTEIYRRSQRGYRCTYDCTDIYRDDDDDEGRKMSFTIAQNLIYYIYHSDDDDDEGAKKCFKIAENRV